MAKLKDNLIFWREAYSSKRAAIVLILALLMMILNIGINASENAFEHQDIPWTQYFITEGTAAFTAFLLVVPLLVFFEKFRIRNDKLLKDLAFYLLVSLIYGIFFTTIMYLLRIPLYHAYEIDITAQYNDLPLRYLMEYFKELITFCTVYLIFQIFLKIEDRQKEEIRLKDLHQKLLSAELRAVQNSLNQHFLFNTLNMISSLVYENPDKADHLIVKLSDFLRRRIGLHKTAIHTISEEIELSNDYLEIMKARYEDKLQITENTELKDPNFSIPVMVLQPILENAIQYSFKHRDHSQVALNITDSNGALKISVRDNGPGFSQADIERSNGMGTTAVISRMNKYFNENFSYQIIADDQGSEVILEIQK